MGRYLNSADSEWYKHRLRRTIALILATFVLLYGRLFFLQVIEGKEYYRLSENNCIRLQHISPPRGLIYDRNQRMLVDNRPAFDLKIVAKDAAPLKQTLTYLSHYTGLGLEELQARLKKEKRKSAFQPVVLKEDMGRDLLGTVEVHRFDLPGIYIAVNPRREYIFPHIGAHLLGYLGEINTKELNDQNYLGYQSGDMTGRFGVEKTFEFSLRGEPGGRQVEVDARGRVVRVLDTRHAIAGHNLILTLDIDLQRRAEALLQNRVGAVVALDPNSGEVLAMASSPSFDQNAFIDGFSREQWQALISNPYRPMGNKALQGEYPPASTYKAVTAMAGLGEGVITENTTFFCPGHLVYGDRVFHCWKKGGHGTLNVVGALRESCDVFFYHVGQRLGVDRLAWYAKACGLGRPTGIELDHESKGLIPTAAWKRLRTGVQWMKGETLSIAIGQGYNLATPLQMAVLTAAIANGGTRYRPQIFKSIQTPEGLEVETQSPEVVGQLPLEGRQMQIVRLGLWEVVNTARGTAKASRIKGVDMSGKTGTAQIFSRKKKEKAKKEEEIADHLKSHAWFIAYAPSEDPKIAIAVIVEHGEHGSSAAAPIAKELVISYLGIATENVVAKAVLQE